MTDRLRVLFVEDSEDDALLLRRELRRAGYDLIDQRVYTPGEMRLALESQAWDVVISDYSMPGFTAPQALTLLQSLDLDLPFIIVSGTVGEETAVAALKSGADDFMTKDRLSRFVPAIERALRESEARRARRQRERELEAIAALTGALRLTETRQDIIPAIVDQALDTLKGDEAGLGLHEAGAVRIALGRGRAVGLTGQQLPGDHPLVTGASFGFETATSAEGLTVSTVPLSAGGAEFGILWVGRARPFRPEDLRLLTTLAGIAASALHRTALFEQTQRRLDRLTALRTVDLAINASQDMAIILEVLLGQVQAQLQADAAVLLLVRPITHTLEFAAGRGLRTRALHSLRQPIGVGLAGRAALEARRIFVSDLRLVEPGIDVVHAAEFAAEGFISYHAVPLVAKGSVNGVLQVFHRAPLVPDDEWIEFLETLAGQAAIAVNNTALFEGLQRSHAELARAYDATIEGWSRALDLRDQETEGHTQRVTDATLRLAQALDLAEAEHEHLRRGALLHDIGKMGIPDSILRKPGPLDEHEWAVMRRHPQTAYELLSPVAYLRLALDIPHYHHEKWDGTGYPYGLRGEQIPIHARLFAVVDVWDALRSNRPYRRGWPADRVRAYLLEQAGRHFDARAVEAFLTLEPDLD
jgi:response regulator RpfG family c-di-GMP phosphodiesterase